MIEIKLDVVGPVDNRPSTAEAPPIGKIHPFSEIALTFEPVREAIKKHRFCDHDHTRQRGGSAVTIIVH